MATEQIPLSVFRNNRAYSRAGSFEESLPRLPAENHQSKINKLQYAFFFCRKTFN